MLGIATVSIQPFMLCAEGSDLSPKLVTALFECLYHPKILHDEDIMMKLGRAMVHLSTTHEMDFTEHHGCCPGLYCLLTHPDVAVRSLVSLDVLHLISNPDFLLLGLLIFCLSLPLLSARLEIILEN